MKDAQIQGKHQQDKSEKAGPNPDHIFLFNFNIL
jgi:hypothetical protein